MQGHGNHEIWPVFILYLFSQQGSHNLCNRQKTGVFIAAQKGVDGKVEIKNCPCGIECRWMLEAGAAAFSARVGQSADWAGATAMPRQVGAAVLA